MDEPFTRSTRSACILVLILASFQGRSALQCLRNLQNSRVWGEPSRPKAKRQLCDLQYFSYIPKSADNSNQHLRMHSKSCLLAGVLTLLLVHASLGHEEKNSPEKMSTATEVEGSISRGELAW